MQERKERTKTIRYNTLMLKFGGKVSKEKGQ